MFLKQSLIIVAVHKSITFTLNIMNIPNPPNLAKFNLRGVPSNYSADTLIPSSSKESEYGVAGSVSVFLCGFYNRMKVHECIRTEV